MIWTTLRQGAKAFALTVELGTAVKLKNRKQIAVQIAPTAYIPPSFPCPALAPDGLCGIHADKPARCRTMPFSPYREERDQDDLLVPKPGWLCDTSAAAPVVYRDGEVVGREDFDRERRALRDKAATLRAYADRLATNPEVAAAVEKAAKKPRGGYVVLNFSTILPRLPQVDAAAFSRLQLPVLTEFAERTADDTELADYHRYYRDNAAAMARFLEGQK
jgi:Fe-S-cluster containining protein